MSPSTDSHNGSQRIEAYRVSEHARLGTLPRHFGRRMMVIENTVYQFMREFCCEYQGGYWHFYELSNGGFYMAPELPLVRLFVPGNGFQGAMSADAAGITVCLYTFSHLSFEFPGDEVLSRHFHRLRDFAAAHPDAAQIFAAID